MNCPKKGFKGSIFQKSAKKSCKKDTFFQRPIAVGLTLRRLVSKICNLKLKDACKETFLPAQVGVGIEAGAEAAIHSCRKFIKLVDT